MKMPPTTTDVAFAKKWSTALSRVVGINDKQKPIFAVPRTQLEMVDRMDKLCRLVGYAVRDVYWSFDRLSSALQTLRAEDERQIIQDELIAAGQVVAVERHAEVEARRQQDNNELRAKLEEEHVANAEFKQQVLESQKVMVTNQKKLETRSIKLARRVEHLSAKKVVANEDDDNADSHDNAEDSHSQLSWRPSRADPSTPTPSSSRRRRPLPTEASSPSSSSSSRPELALVPPRPCSSSSRTSSFPHPRSAADRAPTPSASGSTDDARTRRRSAYTLTSGSSMVQHGIDDVLGNAHAKSKPAAASREDVKLEVGAAEIGAEASSSSDEGDEASSSSDEADDTGHKLRRTSSGAKAAAAIADEDGEGTSLEHVEPEIALDARDSRSGSSTGTSNVRMAPRLAQRRYIPTRSIFEEAASRGDLPSPSASASREAPARGALKRSTNSAATATAEHDALARSGAQRAAGGSELGKEDARERAGLEEETLEAERIRARLADLGLARGSRERSPGRAASSGFNGSPSDSDSDSPLPSPNVTPRSRARRGRKAFYREAGYAAVFGHPRTPARSA